MIQLKEVSKQFGKHPVVSHLSLTIGRGEIVALLGPSGCGKTTILRMIAGLEMPDQGQIWIDNKCVSHHHRCLIPPHQRKVGFVFQDLALWPHLTVEENLDFVLRRFLKPKQAREERITETLQTTQAVEFVKKYPSQLSGGEQQRVALARSLVYYPRILLLDEPFAHLDLGRKEILLRDLRTLLETQQITTLLITHDQADANSLAHRVLLWEDLTLRSV